MPATPYYRIYYVPTNTFAPLGDVEMPLTSFWTMEAAFDHIHSLCEDKHGVWQRLWHDVYQVREEYDHV